jgi:hypothetical protein
MARKAVGKSKRQYTKRLNNPAGAVVRDDKDVRHGPPPWIIEPCLAQARPKPPDGDSVIERTTKAKPDASFSVASNSARWSAAMSRRWLLRPRSM